MPAPMPLPMAPQYPVAAGIPLIAIVATVFSWTENDLTAPLVANHNWIHAPWTLATTMFPHSGLLHLAFNCF